MFKGSSSVQINQTNANLPMVNVTITNLTCMVLGAMTLLKQFNPEFRNQFIAILSQYIRSSIRLFESQRATDLPVEVPKVLSFLEDFIEMSELDRKVNFKIIYPRFDLCLYINNNSLYIDYYFPRFWRRMCQNMCLIR